MAERIGFFAKGRRPRHSDTGPSDWRLGFGPSPSDAELVVDEARLQRLDEILTSPGFLRPTHEIGRGDISHISALGEEQGEIFGMQSPFAPLNREQMFAVLVLAAFQKSTEVLTATSVEE